MKIRKLAFISTFLAFLVPMLVVATVVISYTYPTSTNEIAPKVYLAQGPNYNAANAMGLFSAKQVGTPANISSGTTIYLNNTYGDNEEALLNVLEIVNNSPSGTTVKITFDTVSLPSGVTMYISNTANTELTYSVTNGVITINGGSVVSSGTTITLSSSGAYYIGFLFSSGATTGTGTIAFSYAIT